MYLEIQEHQSIKPVVVIFFTIFVLKLLDFFVCEEVGLKSRGMIADHVIVLQSFAVSFHKTLRADRAGPVVLS